MSPLVRELLVNGLMAGTAVRQAKKTSVGFGYYALAGGVACLALVFFSIAGYTWLQEIYTLPVAAAITGAVIAVLSGIIGTIGYCSLHKKAVHKPAHSGNIVDLVESTVKQLMEGIEEPVKDNPKMAMLMAALAGFAAADKIGDRIH